VPQTGIIDYSVVLNKFSETLRNQDCKIIFNSEVTDFKQKNDYVEVICSDKIYESEFVISCTGLQSDRLAKKTKKDLNLRIIPFRGEYYKLREDKKHLVKTLIYPVPDPSFPFLGVHFTKKINGEVEAGPNAVLSFKREGYSKVSFNLKDSWDTFSWSGFHKVALSYWKTGFGEFYRSYNKLAFTSALKKLVPQIEAKDLIVGGAGVRAQACDSKGNLLDDFAFVKSDRILHVCNAPSPAATASLAIGEKITEMFLN
jgi:L-2-hydroxyglutarate oxidase